jgi:hypothetical protein
MLDYLIHAFPLYFTAYQSGALHLDNNAIHQYATGWLVEWLEGKK